jgi:hypothetical protein
MGAPLATSFDVAAPEPVDSRFIWTGTAENLNQIAINGANRYPGLVSYVINDQNLYVYQGNNIWEKIVTNNVDSPSLFFNTNFNITPNFNGQVLYVDSLDPIVVGWGVSLVNFPKGFNVTIVQVGDGSVQINSSNDIFIRNRFSISRTAGRYAIASILRIENTSDFLLYGDLV